jgi:hypothetical protein
LEETSALIYFDGDFWTLNDSGNKPAIYRIDSESGKVIQTVYLENVRNNDWEALAQDSHHIYIGDFGNNQGKRTNLAICKIKKSDIHGKKNCKVTPEIINIAYSEQVDFNTHKHNFDCESLISYGDSLLLFTKNRGNLKTDLYAVPKIPGSYNLTSIGSFDVDGLVTDASYNEGDNKLLLIGYKDYVPFIFVFDGFFGDFELISQVIRFNFIKLKDTQTEGICRMMDDMVYFSSEKTNKYSQRIYKIDLKEVFQQTMQEWK